MDTDDDDLHLKQLHRVLPLAGLTPGELWMKYFSIGGSAGQFEIEAYLYAAHALPALERDLVAHALNERFMDLDMDLRVSYSTDSGPGKAET